MIYPCANNEIQHRVPQKLKAFIILNGIGMLIDVGTVCKGAR